MRSDAARLRDPEPARERLSTPPCVFLEARILVVDHEENQRRQLLDEMARAGFEVEAAATGEEALELMRGGRFDVVVLDLLLPGINGLEVLDRVGRDARLGKIRFVVRSDIRLTGRWPTVLGPAVAAVVPRSEGGSDALLPALYGALASS